MRKSFTDIFIKHPVLAVVVNLVIVLVGVRALFNLPVQQFPSVESSQVIITTVYTGASAETVRGFLTTPIERVVTQIAGVDYVESSSRAGVSTVTVQLKLDHNSTDALAEVTARLQQVRSELPAEAEPPIVDVRRADRPYATFYLGFTSPDRTVPELSDWLARTLQPQLSTLKGVQKVSYEGNQPLAMRVWIDPDRLAAHNLAPGDVHEALRRNNYLAAIGQTKSDLVQVNLLANTDLRAVDEFKNLIVADRDGAIVRLSDVATVELGAEEAALAAKYNAEPSVYLGVWPLPGSNEIEVASRLREEMERIEPNLPSDIQMRLVWDGTMFMRSALEEITKTLGETVLIVAIVVFLFMGSVRTALVPLVAMPVSLVGAAIVMIASGFSLNLLTLLAIVLAGGLMGSVFLEFAITLAAAVVVSGIVALTLSPVMSSRFVHEHGHETKLTVLVNRAFGAVSRTYERLLDRALGMRWGIVAVAVLVTLSAWPLYTFSRQELAPVEDQSHISMFFESSPDSSLAATDRHSQEVVKALTAMPEADFVWSLTANWGGFGGM